MKRKLSPARLWWKWWWRQQRIIKLETTKQYEDMLIFGTGYIQVGPDIPDGIKHIPIQEVRVLING